MFWRVIVRLSFTGKNNASLRSPVVKCLKACGLKPTGAIGTWEGRAVNSVAAAKQFAKVLELLSAPDKIGIRHTYLDHLWIYIDRAKAPQPKPAP